MVGTGTVNSKSFLYMKLIFFFLNFLNLFFSALNVPVTDHTFEDCRLMISAGQLTLPMEAGLVEFTKISKKLK